MKKLLSACLFFAFCLPFARGQTITFPPGKLASEEYVQHYVDSVLQAKPVVQVPPVITLPAPPTLQPCKAGPEIRTITSVTEQSLVLVFHGEEVHGMDFEILKNGAVQRAGKLEPKSNTLTLGYESLSGGTYSLRLIGNTCLGSSEPREFTIEKFSGQVNPPKIPVPDPGRADQTVQPVLLSKSHPYILDVTITGTSENWLISDVSTFQLREGYEFLYLVNNDIVRTSQNLTNYHYAGNTPVRIQKHPIKKGAESLARWDMNAQPGSWFDKDASYAFGPISDVGGVTAYYFKGGWLPQSQDLAWVNPVPAGWQPKDYSTWPESSPAITLPANKVYVQAPHTEGQTISQLLRLGVTHYSQKWRTKEAGLPADRVYNDVPQTRTLLNLSMNGNQWVKSFSDDHIRAAARRIEIMPVMVNETMEGDDWIPQDNRSWGIFYDELGNRIPRDGKRRYLSHNYYDILPNEYSTANKKLTDLRWVYNTPARNLPRGVFSGTLKSTNTHMTGWYKNAPDETTYVYKRLYNMQVSRKLGLFTGVFIFPVHEWLPGFSWQVEVASPAGKFSRSDKAPLSPSELVTAAFLGLDEGDIAIVWDTDFWLSKNPADQKVSWMGTGKDRWEGPGEFPYKSNGAGFGGYPQWTYDVFHFGVLLYSHTSAATDGGESHYASFRIDGGSWITPRLDGSDVLDAWDQKRGLAKVTKKGKVVTISYVNPAADNQPHSIEIRDPDNASRTWRGTVFGDVIHSVNLSI
ncbi:hypothetical protein [Persicitalea jodogahamensis]|uniref:Uncharacterized protein n=1 Tax=Persicitalea jodogahamensis TaxID=402147 RepID=A0A8J3G8D8_9BACT|nr:hypothetical protein [Persicitalea jodogahamensis]GHB64258.1 hypothetical protein GCM10007390_17680 [Persicitalea jodogahamensis]